LEQLLKRVECGDAPLFQQAQKDKCCVQMLKTGVWDKHTQNGMQ
jgi:hypothetical protein